MKTIGRILLIATVLALGNIGYSKMIDSPYEVGTWPGFREAAVSYTFDDDCSNQFAVALPMFDKFGFKMTFFTVIDWVKGNWDVLKSAALEGHEVASHTMTHPSLNMLSKERQEIELKKSQEAIDANIPKSKCLTIAYPNCRPGDVTICKKYYIAARNCQGKIEKSTPDDFMNISSIICGTMGSIKTAQDFTRKFEDTAASKGWCDLLLHGIDNDGGYSPCLSTELKGSLEYLAAHKDKFWVETFVNVVRYIRERDDVSVKESATQDNSITVKVTDTLDNEIYNYPVTIRLPLPQNWKAVKAAQNDKAVNSSIVEVNSAKYIMFDAIPDKGDVVLSNDN